jgi:hypothetical protein
MLCFRYRTATLLGPWRATSDAALADAIRAKQARRDEDGIGWHWVVPGSIEEREAAPQPFSHNDA